MRPILTISTVLALAVLPVAGLAKPHGNGNGNGNGNGHMQGNNVHGCPPGLAGRDPACVPPGLARQGVTTENWIGPVTTEYHEGDILNLDQFFEISDLDRFGLPLLPDGQQYAVIDGTLVRLDSETYQILQLIRAFAAVGN